MNEVNTAVGSLDCAFITISAKTLPLFESLETSVPSRKMIPVVGFDFPAWPETPIGMETCPDLRKSSTLNAPCSSARAAILLAKNVKLAVAAERKDRRLADSSACKAVVLVDLEEVWKEREFVTSVVCVNAETTPSPVTLSNVYFILKTAGTIS